MDQSLSHTDEDQYSLFGSPPPSPPRGRSPSQETFIESEQSRPATALPSAGVGRKNVGTIALPGSHMSCAELPADLPAARLSLLRPTSSHDFLSTVAGASASTLTPVAASHSPSRPGSSAASSAASTTRSVSNSVSSRKRRASKAKSLTPALPPPPIPLPGPDEPTPPNFLRSQSSLLGLAGLVGCVKPAQLHTYGSQPSPARGSTPTNPIVLDDDQGTPHIGKQPCGQPEMPQRLDQLNPDALRSNIMNSLTKEKNIFPVLESLIKLFGGEPLPSANPSLQLFARPYGHGIFDAQYSPVAPSSVTGGSKTSVTPPQKRRKLRHVPAGAVDWDIPFPFAAGEGPEGYRNTWAQDRAKQLVTQLLELVRGATKRAAIKTAKNGENAIKGRAKAQNNRLSRSASVETRIGEMVPEGLKPVDKQCVDPEGVVAEGGSGIPCDYSAFEEWLSQLPHFVPLERDALLPGSDRGTHSPAPPNRSTPSERDILPAPQAIRDEAIDPALLAISRLGGSASQSQLPGLSTPPLESGDILDVSTPPVLVHSPRTSRSSLTEPLTPQSESFADASTSAIAHQNSDRDLPIVQPTDNDHHPRGLLSELFEPPCTARKQKGKARADVRSTTPPEPSRPISGAVSTSKGVLDKQAILERARERRRQLVAEIERAKLELWETSIENAVLVHLTRDESLCS